MWKKSYAMNKFLFLSIFTLLNFQQKVEGTSRTIDQCFPKLENHTLCHGTTLLNSVSSFSGLLRNSNSGYSVHQSNIWILLIKTKCHKDLEKLLCTIYAPTCLKGHSFKRIYPCRQLCESVKEKCLPRMKNYGFEWPIMVDCNKFSTSKDAECVQLSDKTELSSILSKIKKQREDRSLNNTILSDEEERKRLKNCKVCHRKVPLEVLAKKYCESTVVIKAKIVQIFNRPKTGITLRLHHKSKRLSSRSKMKSPITNLITELQCTCPLLEGKFNNVKWLLLGDMENGQFVVKFLTKWLRRHKKFRFLIKSLNKERKNNCQHQKRLIKSVYSNTRSRRSHKKKNVETVVKKGQMEKFSKLLSFDSQLFDN